jgi:hypothetical protein
MWYVLPSDSREIACSGYTKLELMGSAPSMFDGLCEPDLQIMQ